MDEAPLTGEWLPINKAVDDEIFWHSTCIHGDGEAIGQ